MRFPWRTDVRYVTVPEPIWRSPLDLGPQIYVVGILRPSHSKDLSQISKLSSLKGKQYQYYLRLRTLIVAQSQR